MTVATDYKEQEIGETETIVQKGRKGKATEGWFYRPVLKIRFRNLFPQISDCYQRRMGLFRRQVKVFQRIAQIYRIHIR